MLEDEKLRLVQDHAKIDNMVDQVASFLASMLQIKEVIDEDDRSKTFEGKTLVQLSREEIHHFPTRARHQAMKEFDQTQKFVLHAADLARRMRIYAARNRGMNVEVAHFVDEDPYYVGELVTYVGETTYRVPVGGIYFKLMEEVGRGAFHWLQELDRVLCEAASIERGDVSNKHMASTFQSLASAIAKRVALEDKHAVLHDDLSSRALDSMINAEVSRTRLGAEHRVKTELLGLEKLKTLASAPSSNEARRILSDELKIVLQVVTSPPRELLDKASASSMNLEQLKRAFRDKLDVEVRVTLVSFWAECYGSVTRIAISEAVKQMQMWKSVDVAMLPSLLRDFSPSNPYVIPETTFLHVSKVCISRGRASKRNGFDEFGLRKVRLIQCIWELCGKGVFLPGVVSADLVADVAHDSTLLSRMGIGVIAAARRTNALGMRLAAVCREIHDLNGDHYKTVEHAACALSMFSCEELEVVFDTDGGILNMICGKLSVQTRKLMSTYVSSEYRTFATDALALTLPVVETMRGRIGISPSMQASQLVDMLMTTAKVKAWDPLQGTLKLHVDDFRGAHKELRPLLDMIASHNVLVKVKGTGASKRKIEYVFDTWTLQELLWKYMFGVSCLKDDSMEP